MKYEVTMTRTIKQSVVVEVEADDTDSAIQIAINQRERVEWTTDDTDFTTPNEEDVEKGA